MCWRCSKDVDDEDVSEEIDLSDFGSDSETKRKRNELKAAEEAEENRPYDPSNAAYPEGFD